MRLQMVSTGCSGRQSIRVIRSIRQVFDYMRDEFAACRLVWGLPIKNEKGQATVEFAIVTAGFLAIVLGLGSFWHSFDSGVFVEHALAAASHHINLAAIGAAADIFLY